MVITTLLVRRSRVVGVEPMGGYGWPMYNGTPLASRLDRRHAMRPPRTVLGGTFDTESQTLGLRQSGVTHPISRGEGGWDER